MYVYIRSEASLWTVGFYAPDGKWMPESDHDNVSDAAVRVHWLNGGDDRTIPGQVARKKAHHGEGES